MSVLPFQAPIPRSVSVSPRPGDEDDRDRTWTRAGSGILAANFQYSSLSSFYCARGNVKVDLRHMDEKSGSNVVDVGVDLSEFYMSVEWDILEVPAVR